MISSDKGSTYFPPEWHPQSAIQLTWPTASSDWKPYLEEAEACFLTIAKEIIKDQLLILVVPEAKKVKALFSAEEWKNIIAVEAKYEDTWARDHGGISAYRNGLPKVLDFKFNAWGGKFECVLDNEITQKLFDRGVFDLPVERESHDGFVLEGGSIESNGNGVLLTTEHCLLNQNRNEMWSKEQIEDQLKLRLGVQKVLWIRNGGITGDDTDSHVDTLARFIGQNMIAYVRCLDSEHPDYAGLKQMEEELLEFEDQNGSPFELFPLPMPDEILDQDTGERLPATYANFLIMNQKVLLPIYGVDQDQLAFEALERCFPSKKIVPINCEVLIRQHGSLHCITMQYPEGFVLSSSKKDI